MSATVPSTTRDFKPVILITGCSSGIGLALADLLHSCEEYRVVVTARPRSLAGLQERFSENDRFMILPLDITSSKDRINLVKSIESRWHGVNILINNAGISYRAALEHMDEVSENHQISTNYLGPVDLIRLVLPKMREAGRGKIINVSSVSGMLAMPTMGSYSASKHALEGMSEALWYELRPLGINVSLIQPGFIKSRSFERVYFTELSRPGGNPEAVYADFYANMAPFIARFMQMSLTTPEMIAARVLKVIRSQKPPLWIPATLDARIFYYLRRFVPRRFLLPLLFLALPQSRSWALAYTKRRK